MNETSAENNFIRLVAYFLAEIIRSRRTSIRRAAEISQAVVGNLDSLVSETEALAWATEIAKDFQEVTNLKQALCFNYQTSDIKVYEREIKEYASGLFETDIVKSASFLKDASRREATIQQLCIKYPEFCDYLMRQSDKAQLLPEFQKAS